MNKKHHDIPWVEKYRPTSFENIVLDTTNEKILNNIIKRKHFPNLLFYGPPGTGKTTTIINLIKRFQPNPGLMIHLNASDERGIDVIRVQINQFVNTKGMFGDGLKFVILDEVDYMTKSAHLALKYLLQTFSENVRFCLICNYISRIDESLQNEFIRLKFVKLPDDSIIQFLSEIIEKEQMKISTEMLTSIRSYFGSDIRSMINYLQSNQGKNITIITNDIWKNLISKVKSNTVKSCCNYIDTLTIKFNCSKPNIIKLFFNYIIRNTDITSSTLNFMENIIHNIDDYNEIELTYIILKLKVHLT